MTITTEFVLRSPSLPLVSIANSLQPNKIECVHGLCLERDSREFMIQIEPSNEVSEAELLALDEVVEATTLGHASGKVVYQLTVELKDPISEIFAPERFDAAQMEPTVITPEGWHEKKVFKNYEMFNEFQTRCKEYGVGIELVTIASNSDTANESREYGLTDRQHEALTLAISRGYYESPRQTSTDELAEELGISQPSMSNLLRRGERQLLTSTLDTQKHLNTLSA